MTMKESLAIVKQKGGSVNAEDRLDLARILIKMGYTVAIEKRKTGTGYEYAVVAYVQEG